MRLITLLIFLSVVACSSTPEKKKELSLNPKGGEETPSASENEAEVAKSEPKSEMPTEGAPATSTENNAEAAKEEGKEKAKVVKAPEEPKREIGSLWSAASSWNNLFSKQSHRKVGDRIYILVSEKLRENITKKLAEKFPDHKDKIAIVETARIPGNIKKIGADGEYQLEGAQAVFFGSEEREVKFTGTAREQELNEDDSIPPSSIAAMKITVEGEAKKDEKEEGKEEKKEVTKKEKKKNPKVVATRSPKRKQTKSKVVKEFQVMKKNRQAKASPKKDKDSEDK